METVEEAERVTDVEELSVMPVFNATDLEKLKTDLQKDKAPKKEPSKK